VVLHPAENDPAAAAVAQYRACLADRSTFDAWTLETFIGALEAECSERWTAALRTRYLG
jgi:hypothetical protein